MLKVRQTYRIFASRQLDIPLVQSKGLLIMVHELPDAMGTQVTALNFAAGPIDEQVPLQDVPAGEVVDMFRNAVVGTLGGDSRLRVKLAPYEGTSYLIRSSG